MEIKIPKEVRQHSETIFFGLSTRQFICAVLAVGLAVYALLTLWALRISVRRFARIDL